MRISFKNLCFLRLKPPFLADEIALFCIKKRRFFPKKHGIRLVLSLAGS